MPYKLKQYLILRSNILKIGVQSKISSLNGFSKMNVLLNYKSEFFFFFSSKLNSTLFTNELYFNV